jgi:uncharacterized membrane protein
MSGTRASPSGFGRLGLVRGRALVVTGAVVLLACGRVVVEVDVFGAVLAVRVVAFVVVAVRAEAIGGGGGI